MANIKSLYLDSSYIFRFLSTFWDLIPTKDRKKFAETWKGYEQIFGDLLVRGFEHDLAISVNDMAAFMTQRWNKYTFDNSTRSDTSAVFISGNDLGEGVDLRTDYMIAIEINPVDSRGNALDTTQIYEIDCRGNYPEETTADEIAARINTAVGFRLAETIYSGTLIQLTTLKTGPRAVLKIHEPSSRNATYIILGVTGEYDANPYPWRFKLPSEHMVWDIPSFQDKVRDLSVTKTLTLTTDYVITPEKYIHFKERPPESTWWARDTYINERLPAYNFGWLVDYVDNERDPNDYLLILQGLWFAYWMGPRPEFMRRCLYLLFGLPVALAPGIVTDIQPATSQYTTGTVTVTEFATEDTVVYTVPAGLKADLSVGSIVEKFTPICTGIEIFDKVNRPGFVATDIGRYNLGRFLLPEATLGIGDTDETKALKLLEEHTFLPQINVFSFVRPNISIKQVRTFLDAIKPLHKVYHLQMIIAAPDEAIDVREKLSWHYDINITPTLDMNLYIKQADNTRNEYENGEDMALYLDSEGVQFGESVSITVSDINGPRPDLYWSIYQ